MVVKRNQPLLYQAIDLAFAALPPINLEEATFWQVQTHITTDKAHGRLERRPLESTTALNDYLEWPGVTQVLRRTCQRTELKRGKTTTHVRVAVTSLPRQMVSMAQVELLWRRHWTIENQLHHVRDVSLGEDRCQVHTGSVRKHLLPCAMVSWPCFAPKAGLHHRPLFVIFVSMCNMLCFYSVQSQLDTALMRQKKEVDISELLFYYGYGFNHP